MKKLKLLFFVLSSSLVSAQLPTPVYQNTFDESNWATTDGFLIDTHNTANITRTYDAFDSNWKAVAMGDGHGKLAIDDSTPQKLKNKGTIAFFMRIPDPTASQYHYGGDFPILFLDNGNSNNAAALMISLTSGNTSTDRVFKISSHQNATTYASAGSVVRPGTNWGHYIFTYQFGTGGFIRLYQNGRKIIDRTLSHNVGSYGKYHFFGFTQGGSTYRASLSGSLDEINAYDTPFTDDQAKELYASYLKIETGDKIAKYNFDNTSNRVKEHFGKFPDLTLYNVSGTNIFNTSDYGNSTPSPALGFNPPGYASFPQQISNNLLGTSYTIAFAYATNGSGNPGQNASEKLKPIITIPNSSGTNAIRIGTKKGTAGNILIKIGDREHEVAQTVGDLVWRHIAITINMQIKMMMLYMEGSYKFSVMLDDFSLSDSLPILLGRDYNTNPEYMHAMVDDIIFDDKIQTAQEIKKMYYQWRENLTHYEITNETLGTDGITKTQKKINIFPNPTTDVVHLSEKADVAVYDVVGRLIGTYKNTDSINISTQKQGMYLLKLTNKNGSQTVKVIKK